MLLRRASRLPVTARRALPRTFASFAPSDAFLPRHLGSNDRDRALMLQAIGFPSVDALVDATVPPEIRLAEPLKLPGPLSESEALAKLKTIAEKNAALKSFIGMGYYDTLTPAPIQRNILQNPGWYTSYTPYQAEVSQGRLEMLLNFQTMVGELTGLEFANASLLDEGTAAAEAITLAQGAVGGRAAFFVSSDCHPQTIGVMQTRAENLGIELVVGDAASIAADADFSFDKFSGIMIQYPNTFGDIADYRALVERAHSSKALVACAVDLLALTQIASPGEIGADIAVGSAQRFGVPMMFGGPHAGFMATTKKHHRKLPGRIIGVSKDSRGEPALRMAMQTREQHIRRDKATSNICTAQALLANMAAAYAVYHGPEGIREIAERVNLYAATLAAGCGVVHVVQRAQCCFLRHA
jgi:glycine dehydrogenase